MEERRELNNKIVDFMARSEERDVAMHNDIIALNNKVAIQNGRVFKLERWQWMIIGGGCVITVLITILGIIPLWFVKH